jgi:hypothetical protein
VTELSSVQTMKMSSLVKTFENFCSTALADFRLWFIVSAGCVCEGACERISLQRAIELVIPASHTAPDLQIGDINV